MKYKKKIKTIDFPTPAGTAKIKIDADLNMSNTFHLYNYAPQLF